MTFRALLVVVKGVFLQNVRQASDSGPRSAFIAKGLADQQLLAI